ncbi:hypothetical protein PR003_g1970 [Phytophthora rubi]|uniref:Uncharacterized protein n=1 Tax=Phytophthora rubi TaxID=129364 RepID=A0A6A3NZ52_9STRA|nr:hypothetical protein PR002_g2660 [Phytophthora rubi]KAE9050929.1 hypothetical protein PR001_g1916 [Phytophthora rubi]KAE9357094.1 hypothetical protein PR003_g1970 [Phytophthora rubi]
MRSRSRRFSASLAVTGQGGAQSAAFLPSRQERDAVQRRDAAVSPRVLMCVP